MATTLEQDIKTALNRHSAENGSNTPDFILAQFLMGCLSQWNNAVERREDWYGQKMSPSESCGQETATHG